MSGLIAGISSATWVDLAPEGTHHAFEALPDLAAEIRKRFQRVWVHQVAVADQIDSPSFSM